MFLMTVVNFLLFGLYIGIEVAALSALLIRKTLILNIDYPLLEKGELFNNALENLEIINSWSGNLPVRSNLSLLDSVSTHVQWRYYSVI